jgi:hypothetical protein
MPDYSNKCAHGIPLVDADECFDCMSLEVAKMGVVREAVETLKAYTDDTATQALLATAFGRFVSMKLHNPEHAPHVLRTLREVVRQALPAPKERLMIAQQLILTDLSFEARLPE